MKWGPTLPTLTHGDLNHPQEISSAFGGHVAKWNFSFEKLGGEGGGGGWGGIFQKQNAGSYGHFIISRDTRQVLQGIEFVFQLPVFMSVNSLRAGHSESKCPLAPP